MIQRWLTLPFCVWVLIFSNHRSFGKVLLLKSQKREAFHSCLVANGIHHGQIIHYDKSPAVVYSKLNYQWQLYGGKIFPAGFILPKSTGNVKSAVRCGTSLGIRILPKSGGHCYPKFSFGDSRAFVLDLRKMTRLVVDEGKNTVELGPGHLIGPLMLKLWKRGNYTMPVGSCSTVGIGGLSLGGGHGFMLKMHGLTVQNVLEMEMVDVRGEVLLANNHSNTDLFTALRGAGGGSFGIVTKFKFNLYRAPTVIQRREESYNFSHFKIVFQSWQAVQVGKDIPRNVMCYFSIGATNAIAINYFEFDQRKLSSIPYSYLPSRIATKSISSQLNYFEFLQVAEAVHTFPLAGYFNVTHTSFPPYYWKIKSIYVKRPIEIEGIGKLMGIVATKPREVAFFLMPYGGAVTELGLRDPFTSFVHTGPDILYLLAFSCRGPGPSTTLEEFEAGLSWIRRAFEEVETGILKDKNPQSYQNYIDLDLDDYLQRYYGSPRKIESLVRAKSKYDPKNYFYNAQSIPLSWA